MADGNQPPEGSRPAVGQPDELTAVWERFRTGDPVFCPIDHAPLSLAVDSAAGTYRFVCVQCGASSAWFESGPAGLRVRGSSSGRLTIDG
jgi:hypothetical protein